MNASPIGFNTKSGRFLSYSDVLAKFAKQKGLTPVFAEEVPEPSTDEQGSDVDIATQPQEKKITSSRKRGSVE